MTRSERILAEKNGTLDALYAARVHALIRARYVLSEELAILRQRDEKPKEFADYHAFAESCKQTARREIYGEEAAV